MTKRITIIGGAYGSGKTEFAIAFADKQAAVFPRVGLVDLDIVNPYFRSRDVTRELATTGLTVVSTEPGLEYSDLPTLSPRIYSVLQDQSFQVVFDVGGDPAGARALGRFNPYFLKEDYDFWMVVNPYRPDTRNADEAKVMIEAIQNVSRIRVSGIIGNINLGRETSPEIWEAGLPMIQELGKQLELPVVYQMVEAGFFNQNQEILKDYPVFPVKMRMLPPWVNY